jgi:hypothetical protein
MLSDVASVAEGEHTSSATRDLPSLLRMPLKNDKKHPARLLLVRQLTVEQAKELADTTVKNSGHLCSSE